MAIEDTKGSYIDRSRRAGGDLFALKNDLVTACRSGPRCRDSGNDRGQFNDRSRGRTNDGGGPGLGIEVGRKRRPLGADGGRMHGSSQRGRSRL
jgi:hypothetical protein